MNLLLLADIRAPCSRAFGFWDLHQQSSGLWPRIGNYITVTDSRSSQAYALGLNCPITFQVLQVAYGMLWDYLAFITVWANVYNKPLLYIFSWLPWWKNGKESDDKESACNAGDAGSIPGSGRYSQRKELQPTTVFLPRESHGQRSLWGTVHGVAKSQIQLSD